MQVSNFILLRDTKQRVSSGIWQSVVGELKLLVRGIASRLGAGQSGVWIAAGARVCSASPKCPHPASCVVVPLVISPGAKRRARDVDNSSPSSTEDKNGWMYIFTPSVCFHCVDKYSSVFLLFYFIQCVYVCVRARHSQIGVQNNTPPVTSSWLHNYWNGTCCVLSFRSDTIMGY